VAEPMSVNTGPTSGITYAPVGGVGLSCRFVVCEKVMAVSPVSVAQNCQSVGVLATPARATIQVQAATPGWFRPTGRRAETITDLAPLLDSGDAPGSRPGASRTCGALGVARPAPRTGSCQLPAGLFLEFNPQMERDWVGPQQVCGWSVHGDRPAGHRTGPVRTPRLVTSGVSRH
jgi:hypothetical protein